MKNFYSILIFFILILFIFQGCSDNAQHFSKHQDAKCIEDIAGSKIAVTTGTTQELYLSENYPDLELLQLANISDLLAAIENEVADFAFIDSVYLLSMPDEANHIAFAFTAGEGGDFGVGFNKDDKELCQQFNQFLAEIKADGTYEQMKQRWIKGDPKSAPMIHQDKSISGPVLKVGLASNYPFSFARDNEWCGLECELMVLFGNKIGRKIQYEIYDFGGLIPALCTHKVSAILSSITITEERKKEFLFSDPYYHCSDAMVYKNKTSKEVLKVSSLEELDGHPVALITGTIHDQFVQKHYPNSPIISMNDNADILLALKGGQCDFIIEELDLFPDLQAENPNLRSLGILYSDSVCVGFKKGDTKTCNTFNKLLAELKANGEYDKMIHRWFDEPRTEGMPKFDIPETGEPLVIGTSGHYPHYCEIEGKEFAGLEPELCYRLAEALHRPIEFKVMNFGGLIPALNAGKVDVIVSIIVATEERKKAVLFSNTYRFCDVIAVTTVDENSTNANVEPTFFELIKEGFHNNLIIENRWKMIMDGLEETLIISIFSILLGTIIGGFICWLAMSRLKILNIIAKIYIEILRDVPILVFLMIMFYVVFAHSSISATSVAIIAFALNFGAFVSVMYKTGIEGVDIGQREAGLALGFSKTGTFIHFIIPQAMRSIVPVFKNEAVSLVKNTSIVGYIAIQDLTKVSDIIRSRTFDAFFPLIVISIIYFILAWLLGKGLDMLVREKRGRS